MPKPKQKRIIVLQSSNHDSESDSLRDEDYSEASLNDTIISGSGSDVFRFNGFPGLSILGDSSAGNGSSESDGADTLIGNYFEPSLYLTITTSNDLFPSMAEGTTSERLIGTLGGNDTITGVGYSDGNNSLESAPRDTLYGGNEDINFLDGSSGDDSPNRNDQTLIEPHTDQLFSSGVGSLETTIFLPAVQSAREAAARSSGASSNDGAWALGNIFEPTSGESFSSQVELVGLY